MNPIVSLKNIPTILMALLIAGGLWTYFLPVIEVNVPPVVTEHWSAWEMTKPLSKMATKRESKSDIVKVDFDFMDVLVKILPKDAEGNRKKSSLTFWLGVLVPVSLVLAYASLLVAGILLLLDRRSTFFLAIVTGFGSSVYALAGTYYLGQAAQRAFQQTAEQVSEGFLGELTKHFVRKITIQPDTALYLLSAAAFLILILHLLRSVLPKS